MRAAKVIVGIVMATAVLYSCSKDTISPEVKKDLTAAPKGFPAIPFPADNPYTERKWQLGKQLFYDKILSIDKTISCGSCHKPELAFSDRTAKSIGAGNAIGRRNSPSLANVAYHPYYTREGGVPTLEMQILVPIQEHDEFNFNIVTIAERLQAIPEYVAMSEEVFGRKPDPYVITRAIATFERTLVSGSSAYDQYEQEGKKGVLSAAAVRGKELFYSSRTQCSACHSGFNFTNYSIENNGLYTDYADNGKERLTGNIDDRAKFKVPSLRNVALTAPYMHDGKLATLADVLAHYNCGGQAHINKSKLIKPLGLSQNEQLDIIAFLESLTDYEFINNKMLQHTP